MLQINRSASNNRAAMAKHARAAKAVADAADAAVAVVIALNALRKTPLENRLKSPSMRLKRLYQPQRHMNRDKCPQ